MKEWICMVDQSQFALIFPVHFQSTSWRTASRWPASSLRPWNARRRTRTRRAQRMTWVSAAAAMPHHTTHRRSDRLLCPRLRRPTATSSAAPSTRWRPSAPWRRSTRRRRPSSWWRPCWSTLRRCRWPAPSSSSSRAGTSSTPCRGTWRPTRTLVRPPGWLGGWRGFLSLRGNRDNLSPKFFGSVPANLSSYFCSSASSCWFPVESATCTRIGHWGKMNGLVVIYSASIRMMKYTCWHKQPTRWLCQLCHHAMLSTLHAARRWRPNCPLLS